MKNTLKITTAVLAIALFSGACNYLDTKPETNVKMEEAIENADDLVVATMGLYTAMRSTGYQGVALPVINDITTDIVTKMYQSPSNGHYDSYEAWTFNDNSPEIASLWGIMYATIDRAQRNIIKGKELLSTANEQESKKIHACLAQCYGVKSLTLFNLVNVFALPYNPATASEEFSGVPNIDEKIIEYTDKVERASVEKNYQQILGDLEKAKQEWDLAGNFSVTSIIQYEWMIMNKVAVSAVEARVRLYKQDYEGAKIAAQNVLDIKPGAKKMVYTESDYKNMWSTNVPNSEDIFTLGMNVNENQGTTSIGQFYGPSDGGDANPTYGGRLSPLAHAKIKEKTKDIRWSIIERDSLLHKRKKCLRVAKYNGDQNGKVSNIPVIRLPEIYLILAECENELGNPAVAKSHLLEVARRDLAIADTNFDDVLATDQVAVRKFIREERVRELMLEGHRLFDMRRYGVLSADKNPEDAILAKEIETNSIVTFKNFDVSKFAFPIPLGEINVTKLPQNDWNNNMPNSTTE